MTHDILVIRWDDVGGELVVFARQPFDGQGWAVDVFDARTKRAVNSRGAR